MHVMKWVCRLTAVLLLVAAVPLFIGIAVAGRQLPDRFYVGEGETLVLPTALMKVHADGAWATQSADGGSYEARIDLFGVFPVDTVQVEVKTSREVAVCGMPFGIKMFTEGVLVVGIADVDARAGSYSPARMAGLRIGDTVLSINGEEVSSTEQVAALIEGSGGQALTLCVRRNQTTFDVTLSPVASVSEQRLKAGMWIRDSTAGIGTLTFYDMSSGVFAGLGHPVNDVDTGETIRIASGEIVPANIFGVTKGQVGSPGELLGTFASGSWGILTTNDDTGLYGVLSEQPQATVTLPIAYKQEVKTGKAELITTVDGDQPRSYEIEIVEVDYRDDVPTRNMIIRITDEELLEVTGGVLCGMSGSPIVQDGKLVAAVTHVFVGDPTSGYAIFAENMLESAQGVPLTQQETVA